MDPGTYTLLLELDSPASIEFGAAGTRDLEAGFYTYTGSAFGPGGLSRVSRHQRVAEGNNETRHWHVDYLLGHDAVHLVDTWTHPDRAVECRVASEIDGDPIQGVGATDCACPSHIHFTQNRAALVDSIESLYE